MVKALLIADVSIPLDAVRFFNPARLMLRSLKVASPELLVVRVVVPLKVPVPDDNDRVTETPKEATSLPKPSRS